MKKIPYISCGEDVTKAFSLKLRGKVMEVHSQSVYFEIQDYSLILCCSEHFGRIPFALSFGEDSLVQLRSMVRFGMNAVFLHDGIYLSEAGVQLIPGEIDLCCGDDSVLAPLFRTFADACRTQNLPLCTQTLLCMLGLGQGLTPSADDRILGFIYAFVRAEPTGVFKTELCRIISELSRERTGAISHTYLNAVCENKEFQLLQNLYESILQKRDLRADIYRLTGVGNTSGKEMVKGMLLYFGTVHHQKISMEDIYLKYQEGTI